MSSPGVTGSACFFVNLGSRDHYITTGSLKKFGSSEHKRGEPLAEFAAEEFAVEAVG
jgi:hypothetical protein